MRRTVDAPERFSSSWRMSNAVGQLWERWKLCPGRKQNEGVTSLVAMIAGRKMTEGCDPHRCRWTWFRSFDVW
jgi:hypothetical protein